MKYSDINRKFTEKVNIYLNSGYRINTATMRGNQSDEITHVDLTDGKEIVRVVLESSYDTISHQIVDYYRIAVGTIPSDKNFPDSEDTWSTVWNSELTVIAEESFYKINSGRRKENGYYGTYEEAVEAYAKRLERTKVNYRPAKKTKLNGEKARKAALGIVRRMPYKKSTKLKDIETVYVLHDDGRKYYAAKVKNSEIAFYEFCKEAV